MVREGSTGVQRALFEDYDGFVEKFKPKKTTDDCYTPPEVYGCVRDWACGRYGIDPEAIVRPFWPGSDYERFEYPEGCCVLDNPPFSLNSKIQAFYLERGIPFFLFAPLLTCFSGKAVCDRVGHVFTGRGAITYENGAVVRTAFVTSLGDSVVELAPDLGEALKRVEDARRRAKSPELPKYEYPPELLTAAQCEYLAQHGQALRVPRGQGRRVAALDAQRAAGKAVFGSGLLLSERAAAERAAAERAAAERARVCVWRLSPAEREAVRAMGGGADGD